jgi:hypothetical protein
MGCGGSKIEEEGIQAPLDHLMEKLEIEKLDEIFDNASKITEAVEEIRNLVIDNKDELIATSGACSYIDPKIQHSFYGICWKLSADNKGKFIDAGIEWDSENNSLALTGPNNSAEALNAFNQFNDFVKGVITLPEKMKEIADQVQELHKNISEDPQGILDQVKEAVTDNPFKLAGVLKKTHSNISKIKNVVSVTPKLAEELTIILDFLKDIPAFLKDLDKIKQIDVIGEKANKQKYVQAHEITWYLMEDTKLRFGTKPQQGLKFWDERRHNKKEKKEKIKNQK